jgi:hypothetical protein
VELVLHPSNQTIESTKSKFILQVVLLLFIFSYLYCVCQIVWPVGNANLAMIFATVDGVHCKTQEVGGFNPQYFSHKFKSAGLAYEIVIDIYSQRILWINGPFPAGTHNDLKMFRDRLQEMIPPGHKLLGDKLYRVAKISDKVATRNEDDDDEVKRLKRRALARHETVNGRLKNFAILRDFRVHKNKLSKHRDAFEACCVITQYNIEIRCPLMDV